MLIEDENRGKTGECLLCKHAVLFDASSSGKPSTPPTPATPQVARPASPAAPSPAASPAPARPVASPAVAAAKPAAAPVAAAQAPSAPSIPCVCVNPQCGAKLKFPAIAKGKNVQCPKCQTKFALV
jgi:hypothetical protein